MMSKRGSDEAQLVSPYDDMLRQALRDAFSKNEALHKRLKSGNRIVIVCDTAATCPIEGDECSTRGKTVTLGLLIGTFEDVMSWHHTQRAAWRAVRKEADHSLCWKKIKNGKKWHLYDLNAFLEAAMCLQGMVITVTAPKGRFVFTQRDDVKKDPRLTAYRDWKPRTFEALMRLGTVMGAVIALIGSEGHEYLLLSDHDEIIEGESTRQRTQQVLSTWAQHTGSKNAQVQIAVPSEINNKLAAEDLIAIPDIAAGGMGETLERIAEELGNTKAEVVQSPGNIRAKASEVACWFGLPHGCLDRVALSLHPDDPDGDHVQREFFGVARRQ